jgi:hypothetical protein
MQIYSLVCVGQVSQYPSPDQEQHVENAEM